MSTFGRILIVALLASTLPAGCSQPILSVDVQLLMDKDRLARGPATAAKPALGFEPEDAGQPHYVASVSTVASPELEKREISLAECLALALENGRTGDFYDRVGSDRLTSVSGLSRQSTPNTNTDSMRVFAFDPAVRATEITQSLAKFDAVYQSSLVWNHTDQASRDLNPLTGFQALTEADRLDEVQYRSGVYKPLATGGVAGITFRTDYQDNHLPPNSNILNPAYRTAAELSFEQPLLQGAGVLINQLRDTHPGGLLNQVPVGGRVPGILLSRIGYDQSQLDFERRVHELLFVVEQAYWDLYCAYWDLYSRDTGMKLAHEVLELARSRYEAGGIGVQELAQIETQYHLFRAQRIEALGNGSGGRSGVLEAERRLRYVTGLPAEDGTRLIPCDSPVTTPFEPDWQNAVAEAQAGRPELIQIHQEIRAAELAVRLAKDQLLPDLRFISKYDTNGLGNTLGSSLRDLSEVRHHDWEMGLQLQVPIGFRGGHAEVKRAQLLLGQRYAFLRDQEAKLILSLQRSFRSLVQYREEILARRSQREAAAIQLRALSERFKAGERNTDLLVRTEQIWADSLRDEQVAICNYNVALTDFERQKGTIMQHDNVVIVSGPAPEYAVERASKFIREAERLPRGPGGNAAPNGDRPRCPDSVESESDPEKNPGPR